MDITLYSKPGCGMCQALAMRLDEKKLQYLKVQDADACRRMGFLSLPILVVDGQQMKFPDALAWLNNLDGGAAND